MDIQEREDRTVNVIATGTNQTVTTADAQYVIETYDDPNEFIFTGSRSSQLIVLSPDGNTGYVLIPSGEYPVGETRLPDQEQMIDSFELLSTATARNRSNYSNITADDNRICTTRGRTTSSILTLDTTATIAGTATAVAAATKSGSLCLDSPWFFNPDY